MQPSDSTDSRIASASNWKENIETEREVRTLIEEFRSDGEQNETS